MTPYSDSLPPRLLGTAPAAGAAGGTPGKFTPWNARRPADLAGLQAAGALGQVAAWAPGQYVELRNATRAHWDGDSWAGGPAPGPVGVAADSGDGDASPQVSASSGAEASGSTVPDGTVLEDGEGLDGAAIVVTADGTEHVGILPTTAATELLTVTAGTPGSYSPAVKAAERPRNVTELQQRATPADAAPWSAGEYVPVGERGKAAHWDGETWRSGKAPA